MTPFTLKVTGMSCQHCEKAVTNALEDIGITATVSAKTSTVNGQYDPAKTTLEAIQKEITEAGYTVQ
ncbi:MAG: cation transporter [Defluviitaleaceae bacterium]|nr:cation transporter [Defluviitaleaceae bacterium]